MILFLKRLIIVIRVALSKKKEPFFKLEYLLRYLTNGYFFPSYKKVDYTPQIKVEVTSTDKYVIYSSKKFFYPDKFNETLISGNFNNLLNEQTAIGNNINPHKYLSTSELKENWIIYDIGAAEGSQSKLWLDSKIKQIVLFEPLPSFYKQLEKTFRQEIIDGRVIIINCGISDKRQTVNLENKEIILDTLENIIKEHKLPMPNYIKADIEGEELNLLKSSIELLQKKQLETIQITTYHRPSDHIDIPAFFKRFKGNGYFSPGVMIFNRDGMVNGSYRKKVYHPIMRKCLYSFNFNN